MTFRFKKEKGEYIYQTEDFVGKITLKSKKLLPANVLDNCVLKLSSMPSGNGIFKDEKNDNDISFEFIKTEQWIEGDSI